LVIGEFFPEGPPNPHGYNTTNCADDFDPGRNGWHKTLERTALVVVGLGRERTNLYRTMARDGGI
jgi:hypothetical protein